MESLDVDVESLGVDVDVPRRALRLERLRPVTLLLLMLFRAPVESAMPAAFDLVFRFAERFAGLLVESDMFMPLIAELLFEPETPLDLVALGLLERDDPFIPEADVDDPLTELLSFDVPVSDEAPVIPFPTSPVAITD